MNVNNNGIAVWGGAHYRVYNNRVFNDYAYSGIRMGAGDDGTGSGCSDVEFSGNRVWAVDRAWQNGVPFHFSHGCANVSQSGNVWGDTSLSASIFNEPYPQCQ